MAQRTWVVLAVDGAVATLTLSRPDRLNAYSLEMANEIHDVLDQLSQMRSARVLIITGAGRGFCAGLDMKEGTGDWDGIDGRGRVQSRYWVQERLSSMTVRLRDIPQPVIAAVHGPAVGGGLALAAAADIRIADETARFGAAFIKLALSAGDDGVSWMLPRIVGPSAAAELLYTGRVFDAAEALRIGFVSRVVPQGEDVATAREIADEIVANSPFGIRMTKQLLNFSLDAPGFRQAVAMENRTQVLCLLTGDCDEAMAAYSERRTPEFHDR